MLAIDSLQKPEAALRPGHRGRRDRDHHGRARGHDPGRACETASPACSGNSAPRTSSPSTGTAIRTRRPSDRDAQRKPLEPGVRGCDRRQPPRRSATSAAQIIVPPIVDGRALVARRGTNESDTVLVEGATPSFFDITGDGVSRGTALHRDRESAGREGGRPRIERRAGPVRGRSVGRQVVHPGGRHVLRRRGGGAAARRLLRREPPGQRHLASGGNRREAVPRREADRALCPRAARAAGGGEDGDGVPAAPPARPRARRGERLHAVDRGADHRPVRSRSAPGSGWPPSRSPP